MFNFPIKNYSEFVEKFGTPKNRRNALLLASWKNHGLITGSKIDGRQITGKRFDKVTQYVDIAKAVLRYRGNMSLLEDWALRSSQYHLDYMNGVCEDGDPYSIRYARNDNGKVYKMKAGKFFRQCAAETIGDLVPPQMINYLCELFVNSWTAANACNNYSLHIGSREGDFYKIYDSSCQDGNFHSCMNDEENHTFYSESVDARAAWLEDENGLIIARCVIFDDVRDECTGEEGIRLAERQYSDTELGKEILIAKLIAAGEIDGYKKFGAACSAATAFVSKNGDDWSDREFSIYCSVGLNDRVSYQDSFKWYNERKNRAYNYSVNCDFYLDITGGWLDGEYDEYHEERVRETTSCHYRGEWINVDVNRLDDFVEVNGDYYHEDEVGRCEHCGKYFLLEDLTFSELCEMDFCEDCFEDCEQEYKEENWVQDFYTEEWINPDKCHIAEIMVNGTRYYCDVENLPANLVYDSELELYMARSEYMANQSQLTIDFDE